DHHRASHAELRRLPEPLPRRGPRCLPALRQPRRRLFDSPAASVSKGPAASASPRSHSIDTPHGPARAHLYRPEGAPAGGLLLGHGAGGGLQAAARQLDAAWRAVLVDLSEGPMAGLPVVTGGRSSGARVACRCSGDGVARAVLCLAFPLLPPGKEESKSRLPELDGVAVPALVVQGRSDRFGMPPEAPGRKVVTLAGTHALASDLDGLSSAFGQWLAQLLTD